MLVFAMLALFAASCLAAWAVAFPQHRDALAATLAGASRRLLQRAAAGWRKAHARAPVVAALCGWPWRRGRVLIARHPRLMALLLALFLLPALAVWLWGPGQVQPAEAPYRAVDAQVSEILRGEPLAPPAPLPPEVFTTAEVSMQRPALAGANRDWQLLDSVFSQRLLWVFRTMHEQHGYQMVLLEGYRSPERQNELAAAGSHVTGARAFQSYHQFGLAADCAFLRDGRIVIDERDPWAMRGYELFGKAAAAAGLTWGGNWTMRDFGHAELRAPSPRS